MKICPSCRKTYPDDGLNFCLDDGTVLTFAGNDPPATVRMSEPFPTQPSSAPPPAMQTSWDRKPNYSMQPPKKSSGSWLLIAGVLGAFLLLCGGGTLAGFLVVLMSEEGSDPVIQTTNTEKQLVEDDTAARDVVKADLAKWVSEDMRFGTAEFTNGELIMRSIEARSYYAITLQGRISTEEATTKVIVRNLENKDTDLGYGLVFLSNPKPLQQGYAFLIDTRKGRYRVVRHEPKKEIDVVKWTTSKAVRRGSLPNTLEVRHKGEIVDLIINREAVTSIRNSHGYKEGVPGLYAADGIRIGFKDLEIRR